MDYDVIIVGAGPAGTMAAKEISKEGYSVLVIEKKKKVGYPIQCGEIVGESAIKKNEIKPQDDWIKKRNNGIKIFVPNGNFFISNVKSFSINREKFDRYLVENAIENGCKTLLNTWVEGAKKKNFWYIKTNKGIFKSKILIGADGPLSIIAKQIGILEGQKNIVAIQYKFKFLNFKDEYPSIFLNEKFNPGYAWIFPRGDEFNVGIGGLGNVKERLDYFCKSMNINPRKKTDMNIGLIPQKCVLKSFEKDSALIIGDAAGLTNPIFGGGIQAALFSGRLAAEVINKALEFKDFSILREFDYNLRNSSLCNPLLRKASKIFYSFKNEDFNFVGEVFDKQNWKDVSYIDIFRKFLFAPRNFLKINKFRILKNGIEMSEKLI